MKTVLVIRPEPRNQQTCAKLQEKGFHVIAHPVLSIEPVKKHIVPALKVVVDIMIFPSTNAVMQSTFDWQMYYHENTIMLAVGPDTALALRNSGVETVGVPVKHSSEGLLAMQVLQSIKGKIVMLVTGVGGRQVLDRVIVERGGRLIRVNVYQRMVIKAPLHAAQLKQIDIVQVTSCDCLDALLQNVSDTQKKVLFSKTLWVKSERIQAYALTKGFDSTHVSLSLV